MLAHLVPVHYFVDESPGKRFHSPGDLRAKTGAVGLVGDHGLAEETLGLAYVEKPVSVNRVGLCIWLALSELVDVVVNESLAVKFWIAISWSEELLVDLADVGTTICGGFFITLANFPREPAIIGVVLQVGHGGDGCLYDRSEWYEC